MCTQVGGGGRAGKKRGCSGCRLREEEVGVGVGEEEREERDDMGEEEGA